MVQHYRIVEKIGAGGMGEVYLAEDTKLKRRVALKFLPARYAADADFKARFVREAEATAKLDHPNIVTIHEVSEFKGRSFFAMQLVEGQTLREMSKRKELSIDRIIELAIQICDGLAAAHEKKVVHRDIKPSNVVIDAYGRPKILDFGLAAIQGGEQITKTGSTLGTVRYMSPEQVQGIEVDNRSDLFSLGVVLYELIAGQTPFQRDNEAATLKAIAHDNPEPLSRYKSDIPEELQRTISKLLEKDPSMRYQSASGVISDLKRLITPTQSSTAVSPSAQPRRWPLWTGIGGVAAAAVLLFYSFLPKEEPAESDSIKMLAVLPFDNLGAEDDEYFAAGMTDEITSRLSRMAGLGVISRFSAKKYYNSDKSLQQIGQELGVDYILEGSVRWSKTSSEQRVRITPNLIRVADDRQLWGENYEHKLTEVFEMQSNIAYRIVEALGVTLLEPEKAQFDLIPTNNLQAYDYFLRGKAVNDGSETNVVRAVELFEKAVDLDSNFAVAYAELSKAHLVLFFFWVRLDESVPAKEALDRALAINPNLPQAHLARGFYLSACELEHERGLEELKLAEKYLPNYSDVHMTYSFIFKRQGKWEEALIHSRRALELNPRAAERYFDIASIYASLRNYDKSDEFYVRAISMEPDNAHFNAMRLNQLLLQGADSSRISDMINEISDSLQAIDLMCSGDRMATEILGLWRFRLIDFDSTDILERVSRRLKPNRPHVYWTSMAQVCELIGRPYLAIQYYDSSRVHLEKMVVKYPTDFHQISELGLIYSMLGRHEEAIEYALHAKEVLPLSSCYW